MESKYQVYTSKGKYRVGYQHPSLFSTSLQMVWIECLNGTWETDNRKEAHRVAYDSNNPEKETWILDEKI